MVRVSGTHKDAAMPFGLQKRGTTYYLRRRVPQDLVAAYGKAEIIRSLGTKDLAEAKRRLAVETVKLDAEWDDLRSGTAKATVEVPNEVPPSKLSLLRGDRGPRPVSTLNMITKLALSERALRPVEEGGTAGQAATYAPVRSGSKARASTTWLLLVEQWAAEKKPALKTKKAHIAVVNQFTSLTGLTHVEPTTKADILAFKQKLVGPKVSASTIRTKISRLKTLANYAFDNDLISSKIADGIKVPKSKGKARVPFDDRALSNVFGGPVHKDGDRPAQGRGEASYWLPLIALYTGARLEEIAGLLVIDLMELSYPNGDVDDSWWFFRFSPDPDRNRSLKNEESERIVPVHPELIRLGLIEYRQSIEDCREKQLFPRLTAHASGKRAHKWGQWFGDYLRKSCGVTDKRTVFHSFRHSLKDAGRECGVSEELQRAIMGHAQSGVAGTYGNGFPRRMIVEGMKAIRIVGMPNIERQR